VPIDPELIKEHLGGIAAQAPPLRATAERVGRRIRRRRRGQLVGTVAACLAVIGGTFAVAGSQPMRRATEPLIAAGPEAPTDQVARFEHSARQAAADWRTSGLNRAWRAGLVLIDDPTVVPDNANFTSKSESESLSGGWFRLAATLPGGGPTAGQVRWSDGTAARVATLDAQTIYSQMSHPVRCGGPTCPYHTVTGARPSTVTVLTSRGKATVPAWEFITAGPPYHFKRVAADPGALIPLRLPEYATGAAHFTPIPPRGDPSSVTPDPADSRRIKFKFGGDPCAERWGVLSYETGSVIVVSTWNSGRIQAHDRSYCDPRHATLELLIAQREATVHLRDPLGSRTVLVLYGGPLNP
jgi:hypothetical protein